MIRKINKILLFLFPIFFALPDLTISLSVINLRGDDLIVYLLFMLNVHRLPGFYKSWKPFLFYALHYVLLALVFISFAFVIFFGQLFNMYEVVKSFGSIPLFLIFPILLDDPEYRAALFGGASIAIVIYALGLGNNYIRNSNREFDTDAHKASANFKEKFSSKSLNPNAVALFGILFGYMITQYYFITKKKIIFFLGMAGFSIPFVLFARGHALTLAVAFVIFFFFMKNDLKLKVGLVAGGIFIIIVILGYITVTDNQILATALDVDLKSGKGLSNRDVLWNYGFRLIGMSKGFGYGFATEGEMFIKYFNEPFMAHMIYLHYSIELGVYSTVIFVFSLFYLIVNRLRLYWKTLNKTYLLQGSIVAGFMIGGFFDQMLYFNKYAFLIYVLSTVYAVKEEQRIKLIMLPWSSKKNGI